MERPNPSSETKISGANGDRGILIFPARLTMGRIDNLTRLILTLLQEMAIHTHAGTHTHSTQVAYND